MAASSSDDSSAAPDNFHISSSNGDSDGNLNQSTTKCPLCLSPKQKFYCQSCLRSGDFVHSAHHLSERLCEKQRKLNNIKASLKKCEEKCDYFFQKKILEENLKLEIKNKHDGINVLKKQINEKKSRVQQLKNRRDELAQQTNQIRNRLPSYEDKVVTLGFYVADRFQRNVGLSNQLVERGAQFKKVIRLDIQRLLKYIFPIREHIPKHESSDTSSISDTAAALAEATNTTFVRGKWIFQDSLFNDLQHIIVAPSLPANGDYSPYLDWIAQNKEVAPPSSSTNETLPSTHPAYRISAALTYVTQLTSILSFYLNVRLPHKLAYGDFCRKELTDQQFNRKVSKLNTNIMYLAYTQHVKLSSLNQTHTVTNLLEIINPGSCDLGHIGPMDVADAPLVKSIDSQVLLDLETGTESETDDESSLRQEWESVPHFIQTHDLSPPMPLSTVGSSLANNQQAASIAGGLMTSAAASIASMFRGWTGNR